MTKSSITIGIDASRAFVEDPAGPEYYSWHIIKGLTSPKYKKYRFILYLRPGQKPNFKLPHNFTLKVIGMRYLWTQAWLAFELILRPVDVLFITAHTLPLLSKIFLPHMPIVVTIHGLEGKFLPQSGNFVAHIHRNWSITWAIKLATKLIAVSEDTRTDVIKTYHINAKDIQVIHEGVDLEKYQNAKVALSKVKNYGTRKIKPTIARKALQASLIGADNNYILFVGTLQPRKNLVRLIKAFSQIKDKKVKLVIAGKYGWLYEGILKAPKRYGVENRVVFTGRVDEKTLVGLYRGAKAFVLPSITEGFGLPILEAQAAGVPIVTSNRGALPEVAGNGAIFINPYSVDSITNAIDKVLVDKKLREDLVKKGHKNVQGFSWHKAADNTLTFLLRSIN